MKLGKVLKKLRMDEGWTQAVLARKMKMTKFMIAGVESGRNPSTKSLERLLKIFGYPSLAVILEEYITLAKASNYNETFTGEG